MSKKPEKSAKLDDEALRYLRRRNRARKFVIALCVLVICGCTAYLAVYRYQVSRLDAYADKQQVIRDRDAAASPDTGGSDSEFVIHYTEDAPPPEVLPEYRTLYELNRKMVGWIHIDGTNIDYPVMQTVNNEYYLKHNFDQEEDRNGSIFLDKDCSIWPVSDNLILYGHHMRSLRMFGQLSKYSSKDFYEKHKTIRFDTIYETGTYEVMYVMKTQIYAENDTRFKYYQFIDAVSPEEFNSNMLEMSRMSLYDTGVTAQYGDRLITLSTCSYHTKDGRFVVVAKRVGD